MVDSKDIPDDIAGPSCGSCGAERTVRVSSRFGRETTYCIQCGRSWEYDGGAPRLRVPGEDRRSGDDRRHDGGGADGGRDGGTDDDEP